MQTIGSAEGKHSAGRLPIKSVICYSLVDLVSIVVPPNNVVPYSFCPLKPAASALDRARLSYVIVKAQMAICGLGNYLGTVDQQNEKLTQNLPSCLLLATCF